MHTAEADLTIPANAFLPEQGLRHKLNPSDFSIQEREFLLEHLEDTPAKALAGWDRSIPHHSLSPNEKVQSRNPWCEEHPGINPKGMFDFLRYLRDVEETAGDSFGYYKRDKRFAPLIGKEVKEFHGLEAIRQMIADSLEYDKRFQKIKEQDLDSALHPSMFTRDGRGRLHWQGPGSDRGRVRAFTGWIVHEEVGRRAPDWAAAAAYDGVEQTEAEQAEKVTGSGQDYRLIEGENYFECPVKGCNYRKVYDAESETERNNAQTAMRTHMALVRSDVDDHREAKVAIFG